MKRKVKEKGWKYFDNTATLNTWRRSEEKKTNRKPNIDKKLKEIKKQKRKTEKNEKYEKITEEKIFELYTRSKENK